MAKTSSVEASATVNPAIVLGIFGVVTLICMEIGFAGNFMWWVTAVTAGGLIVMVSAAMFSMAKVNEQLRTGKRKLHDNATIPTPFKKFAVINTLFVIALLWVLDMNVLMYIFAVIWVFNQLVLGGLGNTIRQLKGA